MPLIEALEGVVGTDRVMSGALEGRLFSKDAGLTRGESPVVVFPTSTAEVQAIVRVANAHSVSIVPRGAGTGLAGGAVPTKDAILMVTTKMNDIFEVDEENRTAWVGPGVINLDLSHHTNELGLHFAPDPSSQSACTIGGNVANNSGGPHCLAEGATTSHVLAVEMVDEKGHVVMLGGRSPDPVGLDVRGAFIGSEGTLGIATRILVRLTPNPPAVRTLLASFSSVEDAAATVSGTIAAGMVPAAMEMMDQRMTIAIENWLHAGFPVEAAAVLLIEVDGLEAAVEAEARAIRDLAKTNKALDVSVAGPGPERDALWKGRKSAFGAVAQTAPDYYLHDTVVPRTKLVEVISKVYEISDRHGITMMNVFHAGDGNLHPLMVFDSAEPGMLDKVHQAAEEVVAVCVEAGGSLSGEHGVGLEKRDLMPLLFNEDDLSAQTCVRSSFDPLDRFNPDKVVPVGSGCFDFTERPPAGAWV